MECTQEQLTQTIHRTVEKMYQFKVKSYLGLRKVSLYSGIGPWAHLVTGNHEQTFVAGLTEFALCIGDYAKEDHCDSQSAILVSFALFVLAMAL